MHKRIFEKDLKVPNCKTIGSFFIYQGGCKFQMGLLRAANFFSFIFCFPDHVTLSCGWPRHGGDMIYDRKWFSAENFNPLLTVEGSLLLAFFWTTSKQEEPQNQFHLDSNGRGDEEESQFARVYPADDLWWCAIVTLALLILRLQIQRDNCIFYIYSHSEYKRDGRWGLKDFIMWRYHLAWKDARVLISLESRWHNIGYQF